MAERKVSIVQVFAFVWRYWRRLPLQFAAILCGVGVAVLLEIQIPAVSARLVGTIEAFFRGEGDLRRAWSTTGALLLLFAGGFPRAAVLFPCLGALRCERHAASRQRWIFPRSAVQCGLARQQFRWVDRA
jgi:hypothetical protein